MQWVIVRPEWDSAVHYWAGVGPIPEFHELGQDRVPILPESAGDWDQQPTVSAMERRGWDGTVATGSASERRLPQQRGMRMKSIPGRALSITMLAACLGACASPPNLAGVVPSASEAAKGVAVASGCPTRLVLPSGQGVAIDYVDTFRLHGQDYLIADPQPAVPVSAAQGEPVLGRIQCRLSDYTVDPSYHLRDGDATILPVGSRLFRAAGKANSVDLVAEVDGKWTLYHPVRSN
jgi:hypothetical protein